MEVGWGDALCIQILFNFLCIQLTYCIQNINQNPNIEIKFTSLSVISTFKASKSKIFQDYCIRVPILKFPEGGFSACSRNSSISGRVEEPRTEHPRWQVGATHPGFLKETYHFFVGFSLFLPRPLKSGETGLKMMSGTVTWRHRYERYIFKRFLTKYSDLKLLR